MVNHECLGDRNIAEHSARLFRDLLVDYSSPTRDELQSYAATSIFEDGKDYITLRGVNVVYEQVFDMDNKYPVFITEKLCVSGVGHVKEANVILLMNMFFGLRHKSKCKLENEISKAMGLKAFSHFSSRLNTSLAPDQRIDR